MPPEKIKITIKQFVQNCSLTSLFISLCGTSFNMVQPLSSRHCGSLKSRIVQIDRITGPVGQR